MTDGEDRQTGTVVEFKSRNGFGFIKPDNATSDEDKIFVHWKEITTDDRWPCLKTGMQVEFSIKEDRGKKQASGVTQAGGEKISIQDETKNYNTEEKYTGKVKFFDLKKGFGFITPDQQIEWQGKQVKPEEGLYVTREEICTDDEPPALNEGEKVEFQVYHGEKGLGAGNVSGENGAKIVFKNQGKRRRSYNNWREAKRSRPMGMNYAAMMGNGVDNSMIEIGLHVENKYVGGLIGKGGEAAKRLRSEFGARIQFGDSRIGRGPDAKRVLSVIGDEDAVTKATTSISTKIAEAGDDTEQRLNFLIPDSYVGMFIGKGGSFLKQVRETGVTVSVSNNPVALPAASMVSTATVVGSSDTMAEGIKVIIPKLGQISRRVREDAAMQMMAPMGQPWGGIAHRGGNRWPPIPLRQKW